jgi:TonB family protein
VSIRARWIRSAFTGAALAGLLVNCSFAQTAASDESKRKVKSKVVPRYPALAKRMSIAGKVKIEVVIAPDGHVKSTRALGGHPLLVEACQEALQEWKFAPGPEESAQIVEFDFSRYD